jgi:hypothetical protein
MEKSKPCAASSSISVQPSRQLNQSGLDSATAQPLMSRKRAELEDLMKRGRANVA